MPCSPRVIEDALAAGARRGSAARRLARLGAGADPLQRDRLRLVVVGRDRATRRRSSRCAAPSGSTSDGTPRRLRRVDRRLRRRRRDRPLLVVGDQHHVGAARRRRGSSSTSAASSVPVDRAIALVVDPRHLLVPGRDHAQLARGAAVAVGDHRGGADAGLAQIRAQPRRLPGRSRPARRSRTRAAQRARRCARRWRRRPGGSSS